MNTLNTLFMALLIAIQFLTVIPITLPKLPTTYQTTLSLAFYPVVGLMIGGILWLLAMLLPLPTLLLSAILLLCWVWLTGGLHLDGLADTADGWVGGYGDKNRTLHIMKDPNCGAMGVIAIIMILLLKWASIHSLLTLDHAIGLTVIPILGRVSTLLLFLTTPYIRKNGIGSALQYANRFVIITAGLISSLSLMIFGWQHALVLCGVFLAVVIFLRHHFIKRLGGMTGDTLGATIEISETVLLITLIVLLYPSNMPNF